MYDIIVYDERLNWHEVKAVQIYTVLHQRCQFNDTVLFTKGYISIIRARFCNHFQCSILSLFPQSERSDFSSLVFGWRSKHWPPPTLNLNLYVSTRRSVILQAQTYFSSQLMHPLQNLLSRPNIFVCVIILNKPPRVSLFPHPHVFVFVGLVLWGFSYMLLFRAGTVKGNESETETDLITFHGKGFRSWWLQKLSLSPPSCGEKRVVH